MLTNASETVDALVFDFAESNIMGYWKRRRGGQCDVRKGGYLKLGGVSGRRWGNGREM